MPSPIYSTNDYKTPAKATYFSVPKRHSGKQENLIPPLRGAGPGQLHEAQLKTSIVSWLPSCAEWSGHEAKQPVATVEGSGCHWESRVKLGFL